jgi:hypothetical protein
MILVYTLVGEAFQWWAPIGPKCAASPSDRAGTREVLQPLTISCRRAPPNPPTRVLQGDFAGLLDGLHLLWQKEGVWLEAGDGVGFDFLKFRV